MVLPWLNGCEIYFRGQNTPSRRRVWLASVHMTDAAELWWYYKLEMNNGEPSWRRFVQLVQRRPFWTSNDRITVERAAVPASCSIIYSNQFMNLACRNAEFIRAAADSIVHRELATSSEDGRSSLRSPKTLDEANMHKFLCSTSSHFNPT